MGGGGGRKLSSWCRSDRGLRTTGAPIFLSLSLFVDPDILRVFSVTRGNDIRERHVLDFELIRSDLFCLFSFLYLDS